MLTLPVQAELCRRDRSKMKSLQALLLARRLASVVLFFVGVCSFAQEGPPASIDQEMAEVKAGEPFTFTVTLKQAPTSSEGKIVYYTSGSGVIFTLGCGSTVAGQLRYVCVFNTNKDSRGTEIIELRNLQIVYPETIVILRREPIIFKVVGRPRRTTIIELADVTINLSQSQLLRREAKKLQVRIADLKAAVIELETDKGTSGPLAKLLRTHVYDAMNALKVTQQNFEKLAARDEQKSASGIFFQDLRFSYERALATIGDLTPRAGMYMRSFRFASLIGQGARPDYPILAQATLRVFEQNELAYKAVADSESLTFNLEVNSIPQGATISYFRRGDKPRQHTSPTNSTIHSLPYAIWILRFEMAGYRVEEREHDPFREPNSMSVELKK
jgi:hypothetical protein